MQPGFDLATDLPLAPTLAALRGEPRRGLARIASAGFRYVQLSATQPGLKPRELDHSARRDLAATLRRYELTAAGIDLWIPPQHFADPAHADRALHAAMETIALAAVLDQCPVSLTLPHRSEQGTGGDGEAADESVLLESLEALREAAHGRDVPLADHAVPPDASLERDEILGIGIDPAAWLAVGADPVKAVTEWSGTIRTARLVDLTSTGIRSPIGQPDSRLDHHQYRIALSVSEFHGPVVLDARHWHEPWKGMLRSARLWHGD